MQVEKFTLDGYPAVRLTNTTGLSVELCAFGAGIISIKVPDRTGRAVTVTKLDKRGYGKAHHGLTVGRTSGRIENATFTIGGKTAELEVNNHGVDNLHGGKAGLSFKLFDMNISSFADHTDAVFTYSSPDGEGGYFGNVDFTVTYRVDENTNKLTLVFGAVPDETTLVNLTNHAYFNMAGDLSQPVTEQEVYINASRVGVLDERLIVREIAEVTPQFDFRTPHKMGDYLADKTVQKNTCGYDHPFFLDGRGLDKLAASLYSDKSGIKMEVRTTYPCVVIYGDNFGGYESTCFECEYHPDGIHACPDDCGVCSPEQPYNEITEFSFSVEG